MLLGTATASRLDDVSRAALRLLLGDLCPDLRERCGQGVVDAALGLLDRLRRVVGALGTGPALTRGGLRAGRVLPRPASG